MSLMEKGSFMATIDLLDAYHSIPVHPDYQKYLRFEFGGQMYQYTCVPFGLSSGPRIFTKIVRPIM